MRDSPKRLGEGGEYKNVIEAQETKLFPTVLKNKIPFKGFECKNNKTQKR